MSNKLKLVLRYMKNDRVRDYKKILLHAMHRGYTLCSVSQSLNYVKNNREKLLVLRHDVDQKSPGVEAMSRIENELKIQSSYYFRWKTLDVEMIKRLNIAGHEIGFHFETISDYVKQRSIEDINSFVFSINKAECINLFEQQLSKFREITNVPSRTVASHGSKINALLGISNEILLESQNVRERLGIVLEAYDKEYLKEFDIYISDTQMEINDGFRYGVNPMEAIDQCVSRIMLLTHPNHWAFSLKTKTRRIIKVLILGNSTDEGIFAYRNYLRV